MLPVASPPNAIIYDAADMKTKDMVRFEYDSRSNASEIRARVSFERIRHYRNIADSCPCEY